MQYNIAQYKTVQYNTIQYSKIYSLHYIAKQPKTTQPDAKQRNTTFDIIEITLHVHSMGAHLHLHFTFGFPFAFPLRTCMSADLNSFIRQWPLFAK